MPENKTPKLISDFVAQKQLTGALGVSAGAVQTHVGRPRPTINRALAYLVSTGVLVRQGAGRSVTYRIADIAPNAVATLPRNAPAWSSQSLELRAALSEPPGVRRPVSYQRAFVDSYEPNVTSLLPASLAAQLMTKGKSSGQQPAGTYARKVLEQLLIDLSWSSSRLEGNRKSLLDTRELFERGRSETDDPDATMLLNHKEAIEFMVDAVPTEGMTVPVIRNLQSLLMHGLLQDPADLGTIRNRIVSIQGSVYLPTQVPNLLAEMLQHIVDKGARIYNAVEAAFFFWVNLAYLQPFVDGNKRTSRLSANMPLMLANCAPLSFLDVEPDDYALAMLGIYERLDVSLAVDLFDWTYRRSINKYQVVLESMGGPDPLRAHYREQLGEAIRQIVFFGITLAEAIETVGIPEEDRGAFDAMLNVELTHLEAFNCARYRLPMSKTQEWIDKGRPR
ncbi:Fic family protein [Paraburkholderia sp. D15]|uniref:Fic family protein n=1 Tax=Paraburkholderia sp. D15 TaxID=2880218 RepID=UPI002479710C|nr:Fic family protein [Paraburkholderia sp. D15]WGS53614.1 Fic family protein [Paraburkholderia sp. D15]